MNYVADTHALLWWFTSSSNLGSRAFEIFQECERGATVIFIPTIVIAEALSVFDKKRIAFDFKQLFRKITRSENYIIIPLDIPILQKMIDLKNIPELHDKIIVSTAKYLNVSLITKDTVLQNFAHIKTVW
jgi:PIN domain nuclease of toxin-antitoxin system